MTSTLDLTAAHRPSLFVAALAAVMAAFDALHQARWSAPWNDAPRWAACR